MSMKDRHKWSPEIAEIEFTFNDRGSSGTAVWQSRNELVLKAGAKLSSDPELKKDGTLNFSAIVAEKVRADNAGNIADNVTTTDIVFPSPNLLGIFLRYGGANSWVSLKDENGKTLDEWSKV